MNVFLACMLAAIAIAERSPALRFETDLVHWPEHELWG